MGGGSRLDISINLAACCPIPCHLKAHEGKLESEFVLAKIAAREQTTPEAIRETIDMILRLPKDASAERIAEEMAELDGESRRLATGTLAAIGKLKAEAA